MTITNIFLSFSFYGYDPMCPSTILWNHTKVLFSSMTSVEPLATFSSLVWHIAPLPLLLICHTLFHPFYPMMPPCLLSYCHCPGATSSLFRLWWGYILWNPVLSGLFVTLKCDWGLTRGCCFCVCEREKGGEGCVCPDINLDKSASDLSFLYVRQSNAEPSCLGAVLQVDFVLKETLFPQMISVVWPLLCNGLLS